MEKKEYNFNEKKNEFYNGIEIPVWQSPKYVESKEKAIEMIKEEKYKLSEGDFWILMNTNKAKDKMIYTGLIISHNGCLKINDSMDNKVDPTKFSLDKEGYNGSLVYTYIDEDTYEVGEVNKTNCKNEYPYAMAFKRCFDRVVLKKSKLAFSGIYSEVEADEFKEDLEVKDEVEESVELLLATPKQIEILNKYYQDDNLDKLLKKCNIEKLEDITMKKASELITAIMKKGK